MHHAFDFLNDSTAANSVGLISAFGNERLLKRLVVKQVVQAILQEDADEIPFSRFEGDETEWNRVNDELSTLSLFGEDEARICIVDNADAFVKKNRDSLEKLAEDPPSSGCLVLLVDTWPSNTRLYKMFEKRGLNIDCNPPRRGRSKAPDEEAVAKWISNWAKQEFNVKIRPAVARTLIDLTECNLGLIEQEFSKLVLFVGKNGEISDTLVHDVVGGWRAQTVWETIDAATEGDADQALLHLDRLLQSGEHPLALFGQIAWSLKRYALVLEIMQRSQRTGNSIRMIDAIKQAGFRAWGGEIEKAEQRLKQLGRNRVAKILEWLVEIDLSLKGSHSADHRARLALENLIVKMSRQMITSQ